MGHIYYRQEKYGMAEYHFRRALSINDRSSVLRCYLGMALHKLKRNTEALDMLGQVGAARQPPCNWHSGAAHGPGPAPARGHSSKSAAWTQCRRPRLPALKPAGPALQYARTCSCLFAPARPVARPLPPTRATRWPSLSGPRCSWQRTAGATPWLSCMCCG